MKNQINHLEKGRRHTFLSVCVRIQVALTVVRYAEKPYRYTHSEVEFRLLINKEKSGGQSFAHKIT